MKIEELAFHPTPLGDLTLRRRTEPLQNNVDVFEVKLGDEYLMSSLFTESEKALARLGLAGLDGELDVVIGGLGLGYTAAAALENDKVRRLLVIDLFQEVIEWHRVGLVPMGEAVAGDERCELRQGDFFEMARSGFDASGNAKRFDAVLLDIDHSPHFVLDEKNGSFYSTEGFAAVSAQLNRGGTFGLWSNDQIQERVERLMNAAFDSVDAHKIEFFNPYTSATSTNFVYIARTSL
ncbi:MAG: spermidine synthase [Pyrinomonadaceae bacterium]